METEQSTNQRPPAPHAIQIGIATIVLLLVSAAVGKIFLDFQKEGSPGLAWGLWCIWAAFRLYEAVVKYPRINAVYALRLEWVRFGVMAGFGVAFMQSDGGDWTFLVANVICMGIVGHLARSPAARAKMAALTKGWPAGS